MFTKGPFVVEYFVNIGSFDCDCTQVMVDAIQNAL